MIKSLAQGHNALPLMSQSPVFAQTESRLRNIIFLGEIITCGSLYTVDDPGLTVSNFIEKSIGQHRINLIKLRGNLQTQRKY